MDVLMNDNAMEPFVFVIIPKREEKTYRMNHKDVVRSLLSFFFLFFGCEKSSCLKY
jgi:hypothetical protein